MSSIKTNPEMNESVKDFLQMRGDNLSLYARQRIIELESKVKNSSLANVELVNQKVK